MCLYFLLQLGSGHSISTGDDGWSPLAGTLEAETVTVGAELGVEVMVTLFGTKLGVEEVISTGIGVTLPLPDP